MATKTKPPVVYGDNNPITPHQISEIMRNCAYNKDIKDEWVQWVTGDVNCTSLRSLKQYQAIRILNRQMGKEAAHESWGSFDTGNKQHTTIMAILRTANIVVTHPRHGEVADMKGWFSKFLQSNKSPVQKPLMDMQPKEVSKIIVALEGVSLWKNTIK